MPAGQHSRLAKPIDGFRPLPRLSLAQKIARMCDALAIAPLDEVAP